MNPSRVRDSAAFCSRVRLVNALSAVMSAGLSTAGGSSRVGAYHELGNMCGRQSVALPCFASASTSIEVTSSALPLAFTLALVSSSSFLNAVTLLLAIITRPFALSNAPFSKSHSNALRLNGPSTALSCPIPAPFTNVHPTTSVGSTIWYCINLSNTIPTMCRLRFQNAAAAVRMSAFASGLPLPPVLVTPPLARLRRRGR